MTPSQIALKYLGQTEKPNNMGFNDAEFEKKMAAVGFKPTHAWCCYFAELVFKEAYPEKFNGLDKIFSASCVQTYNNLVGFKYTVFKEPSPDCLVLWQTYKDGKPQPTGHAGIVIRVMPNGNFETVEGNTNDNGGREGYIVASKMRTNVRRDNGLNVLGFFKI